MAGSTSTEPIVYSSKAVKVDCSDFNVLVTWIRATYKKFIPTVTTVTNTYQVLVTDETVICNKATNFTVTLPTAVVGQKFAIKNIGAGTVTVDGAGSDTIDGDLTQSVNQWESMQIQCYSINTWGVL
jgi:hypothetical protein